jgi:hypothetical protein
MEEIEEPPLIRALYGYAHGAQDCTPTCTGGVCWPSHIRRANGSALHCVHICAACLSHLTRTHGRSVPGGQDWGRAPTGITLARRCLHTACGQLQAPHTLGSPAGAGNARRRGAQGRNCHASNRSRAARYGPCRTSATATHACIRRAAAGSNTARCGVGTDAPRGGRAIFGCIFRHRGPGPGDSRTSERPSTGYGKSRCRRRAASRMVSGSYPGPHVAQHAASQRRYRCGSGSECCGIGVPSSSRAHCSLI